LDRFSAKPAKPHSTCGTQSKTQEDDVIPEELKYTESHEWLRIENGTATMGITHFAQEQLGDLTFVELPEVGAYFEAGQEVGTVESVKAASEFYAPVNGEVIAVNDTLEDAPEKVNEDPYGDGWMVRFKIEGEPEGLLSAEEYANIVTAEE
jgi:glycine cleavage system H protein